MKTIILILLLCVAAPVVSLAQRTNPGSQVPDSSVQRSNQAAGRLLSFRDLDQRKVYKWRNGQRSTPSGRQAEAGSAKYVRVWGDSAMVIRDPKIESGIK